jgi:alkylation response protein AidB-like acyl-CoA dehydrogenase
MDLRYGEDGERFRAELREWLDANLPQEWRDPTFWHRLDPDTAFTMRRDWEAAKAKAGWAGISWPKEFGGRGGTPAQKAIYDEELARVRAPQTANGLGLTFLAPTVMAIGTDEQKRDIVGPLLRNEVIWCQGFSEPEAGSDLANIKTRAVVDGDDYVIDGQKIWTSNATHADKMFGLIRTSTGERKHQGLTMVLIDLHSPGIEVRPLVQMSGSADFGEVFFTGARVPRSSVLGAEGEGWRVAMLLLSFERGSSATGQYTSFRAELDDIIALARTTDRNGRPATEDPVLRQRIAQSAIELELLRLHSMHVLTQTERGRDLGAESSMTKLQWSEAHQDMGELFTDVAGPDHQFVAGRGPGADEGAGQSEMDIRMLQWSFMWSRSETIWGGSSQVQRNIVAERLLGLPR